VLDESSSWLSAKNNWFLKQQNHDESRPRSTTAARHVSAPRAPFLQVRELRATMRGAIFLCFVSVVAKTGSGANSSSSLTDLILKREGGVDWLRMNLSEPHSQCSGFGSCGSCINAMHYLHHYCGWCSTDGECHDVGSLLSPCTDVTGELCCCASLEAISTCQEQSCDGHSLPFCADLFRGHGRELQLWVDLPAVRSEHVL
jgi:hypothetical protein